MSSNSIFLLNPVICVMLLSVTFCSEPHVNKMRINMKPAVTYSVLFLSKLCTLKVAKLIAPSTRLNTVVERFSVLFRICENLFSIVDLQAAYPEMHLTLRGVIRQILKKA